MYTRFLLSLLLGLVVVIYVVVAGWFRFISLASWHRTHGPQKQLVQQSLQADPCERSVQGKQKYLIFCSMKVYGEANGGCLYKVSLFYKLQLIKISH